MSHQLSVRVIRVLKNYVNSKISTNVICDVSFRPCSVVKWGICCEQVCPTVHLSVHCAHELCLNGSWYWNTFCSIRIIDVSNVLKPNFTICSSAVYDMWRYSQSWLQKSVLKRGIPHLTAKNCIVQHCTAISAIAEFLFCFSVRQNVPIGVSVYGRGDYSQPDVETSVC